jgi:hypothetical protein
MKNLVEEASLNKTSGLFNDTLSTIYVENWNISLLKTLNRQFNNVSTSLKKKGKAIHVTGNRGP